MGIKFVLVLKDNEKEIFLNIKNIDVKIIDLIEKFMDIVFN